MARPAAVWRRPRREQRRTTDRHRTPRPGPHDSGSPPAGYAEALAELEGILTALERSDVDVDVLADNVQRAAALIAFCRDRIGRARVQIEQVVAELGDD